MLHICRLAPDSGDVQSQWFKWCGLRWHIPGSDYLLTQDIGTVPSAGNCALAQETVPCVFAQPKEVVE